MYMTVCTLPNYLVSIDGTLKLLRHASRSYQLTVFHFLDFSIFSFCQPHLLSFTAESVFSIYLS